jgi:hypothetical protein
VRLTHKFAKRSHVTIFRNERSRSTPLDPKLMFWGVSGRFVTAQKSMQKWPNWCHYHTSSLNKVASEFFKPNAPDPLHSTRNSYFGAFRIISLLHESRCKTDELVPLTHKFGKQSRVTIFATNAADPLHWTQNTYFGAFRTISLLHESRCKTGRTGAINAQVR